MAEQQKEEGPVVRVLGMHIENYKRVELVDLFPEKRITVLAGPNGAGKTSIGDAFVSAIGGKRFRPTEMLRRGAEEGRLVIDIGNDEIANTLRVELVFTATSEHFEVTNADGVPQRAPQELMNALLGPQRSQFDAGAFLQLPRKELADHVRRSVGLDFTKLDEERQKLYDDRTLVGREVASAKARLAALPRPSQEEAEHIDTTSLLKQQEELLAQQREREQLASTARESALKRDALAQEGKSLKTSIEHMERELEALTERIAAAKLQRQGLEERWKKSAEEARKAQVLADGAPDPDLDLMMIRSKLEEAEKHTELALQKKERERLQLELKRKEDEHEALEKRIGAIDTTKAKMLAEAKFPLEGLGFAKSGDLTFKGLPFEQASQAEQIRAAVALGLSARPRLRTMWIKQGSFVTRQSLGLLYDALEEFDGQALVEWARDSDDIRGPCVRIEAGRVAEVLK